MNNKEVTIYDIAEALSLSPSTVSRALKENKRISPKTIDRVLAYAEKVGYQTNTFASNLRSGETKTIGVIAPHLDSKFISSCLAGAEKVASEKGYSLLISQSLENVDREKANIQSMFKKRVDALLVSVVDAFSDMKHYNAFTSKGIPVLFFDRIPFNDEYASVIIDNFEAAQTATRHLIDQGCKNLLHLTLDSNSSVYLERNKGFDTAISDAGINGGTIKLNKLVVESGRDAAHLIDTNKIDGIFAANDQSAIGCMFELQKLGIKIPEDIAFVGFNNDPICDVIRPSLSSINYPSFEMGTLMTNYLIEHILGNSDITLTNKTVLKSKLIIRDSSKHK